MGDVIDRSGKGFWRKGSVSAIEEMWREDAEFYNGSKPHVPEPLLEWVEPVDPTPGVKIEEQTAGSGWQDLGPKLPGDGDVTDVALLNGVMFVVQDGVISYLKDGKTWERLDV